LPAELPQRANFWALKALGVTRVLAVSAVGSLREEYHPGDLAVPGQLIDRTAGRPSTFFGRGIVAHIGFEAPFCPALSSSLLSAAHTAGVETHSGGAMVVIEGPAFSTRAESELYRTCGAHVIGMTALPEAKLAREAGLCYATLACVTDYDTWHDGHESVSVEMVVANLRANAGHAKAIAATLAGVLPADSACTCASALRDAIITPLRLVPDERLRELAPILRTHAEAAAT
jgi:5'-methylthioadenosine phosphorylase